MGSMPSLRTTGRRDLRALLIDRIAECYRRGLDEIVPTQGSGTRLAEVSDRYDAVVASRMSPEEYLAGLTEEELLQVFERQCCQRYR